MTDFKPGDRVRFVGKWNQDRNRKRDDYLATVIPFEPDGSNGDTTIQFDRAFGVQTHHAENLEYALEVGTRVRYGLGRGTIRKLNENGDPQIKWDDLAVVAAYPAWEMRDKVIAPRPAPKPEPTVEYRTEKQWVSKDVFPLDLSDSAVLRFMTAAGERDATVVRVITALRAVVRLHNKSGYVSYGEPELEVQLEQSGVTNVGRLVIESYEIQTEVQVPLPQLPTEPGMYVTAAYLVAELKESGEWENPTAREPYKAINPDSLKQKKHQPLTRVELPTKKEN